MKASRHSQTVLKLGLNWSLPPLILPQSDTSPVDLSIGDNWRQIVAEWLEIVQ